MPGIEEDRNQIPGVLRKVKVLLMLGNRQIKSILHKLSITIL